MILPKESATFFKLPIQLFKGVSYPELALIAIIRKSDKTSGQIISEQMRNSKFPFTDLVPIRRFAEIAGIKFDEQKFRNRREFQMYFQSLLKGNKRQEERR